MQCHLVLTDRYRSLVDTIWTTGPQALRVAEMGGQRAAAETDHRVAGAGTGLQWVRVLVGGARYGVGALLSVVAYPVLAGIVYVVLLVWALATGQATGGPLGLPALLLVGVVVGTLCTVPAVATCAFAELVTVRMRVPRLALVLGSVAVDAVLTAVLSVLLLGRTDGWPLPAVATFLGALVVATPAAVIVAVTAHSGGALTNLVLRSAQRRAERRATA